MERYSKKNFNNIQTIIQKKTGVPLVLNGRPAAYRARQTAIAACCLLCLAVLSAFACMKFSEMNGDKAGFGAAYQGEGRFEIVVVNDSDRELKLQDKVKVMQWSTSREVEGDSKKIRMTGRTIPPHSQGIVSIDIAEGYDVEAMEKDLEEGDWYYFVLTNNDFAFGQDWMCAFDFKTEQIEEVQERLSGLMERQTETSEEAGQQCETGALIYADWVWPTVSRRVSACYGSQENGTFSDYINIAGTSGDEIYAVADGIVEETGFESSCGNFVILDLGDGLTVKYGHLKEIKVSEGEETAQGQVIAALGKTGMAAGPNLLFAVTVNGETVNPLKEDTQLQ